MLLLSQVLILLSLLITVPITFMLCSVLEVKRPTSALLICIGVYLVIVTLALTPVIVIGLE